MRITRAGKFAATFAAAASALLCLAGVARATAPGNAVLERFEGPWVLAGKPGPLRTTDGKPLPLLPKAKAAWQHNETLLRQGDTLIDPVNKCLPAGIPRLYNQPGAFRLAIGNRFAGMFFENHHLFRVITLYKGHFEAIGPGYEGQAVGHWEGDTLVLDTNQFNDVTFLDNTGLPHSDQLHVVERLTVPADGRLHIAMTLTDPETFSRAVDTEFVFDKRPGRLLTEDYCLKRMGLVGKN